MNRIRITSQIEDCAQQYAAEYGKLVDVCSRLTTLKSNLLRYNGNLTKDSTTQYIKYVDEIIKDYSTTDPFNQLLVLLPSKFNIYIGKYNSILTESELKTSFKYKEIKSGNGENKYKSKSFYQLVVDCMGYPNIVRKVMLNYVRKMKIRACVYCNIQYAITTKENIGLYDIDHRLPKSKYPFLCASFYNFHPSCSQCNNRKRDHTTNFELYVEDTTRITPFHLLVYNLSDMADNRMNKDEIDIKLIATNSANSEEVVLAKEFEKMFMINAKYSMLKDEVEECLWRGKSYNKSYEEMFKNSFPKLYNKDNLFRFVFGGSFSHERVHERPLSKLKQDLLEDLKGK